MARTILQIDEICTLVLFVFLIALAVNDLRLDLLFQCAVLSLPPIARILAIRKLRSHSRWLAVVMIATCPFLIFFALAFGMTGGDYFAPFTDLFSTVGTLFMMFFFCSTLYALVWLFVTLLHRKGGDQH